MASRNGAAYLAHHSVEPTLAAGLSKIIRERPADPVRALGEYLLSHAAGATVAVQSSVDPRGLVDTQPNQQVDPTTARVATQLSLNQIVDLHQLTELSLKKAGLTSLPANIAAGKNIKKLELSLNPGLCTLPDEIGGMDHLRILFALGCGFKHIPDALGALPSLYMLSFKSNQLERISAGALAPTIEWLILTDNRLEELPSSLPLGLRKVMLTNNRLRALPDALLRCRDLELIRLADNDLSALPAGFLEMPKLSWVALAGNPLIEQRRAPLPEPRWIAADDLIVQEQLGAGGGGFVHRAVWASTPEAEPVAVKIFRNPDSVSDGDPRHEIDLGSALQHPNVIRVIGASREPRLGLVLELLDTRTRWTELGKPPNFDTCTRDTYAEDARFAPSHVLRTLRGVAAACAHLHSKGFTHGDLYSHNTLVDISNGEAKVGDFGAAYNYEPIGGDGGAALIERLEVRAFGCMAEELLSRLKPSDDGSTASLPGQMAPLVARCMALEVAARPSFDEVVDALAAFS